VCLKLRRALKSGEAEARTLCRQHLVGHALAEEAGQRATRGQQLRRRRRIAGARIETELSAVPGLPRIIEIEHQRHHAPVVIAEAVYMARIARTGGIGGVVPLEILQTQVGGGIDRLPQRGEFLALQRLCQGRRPAIHPHNLVASDPGAPLASLADAGRMEASRRAQALCLLPQRCDARGR